MSAERTFSTCDLRSTAQDYKREAARKHKWALGGNPGMGTGTGTGTGSRARPHRPSETEYNLKRRETKGAVAALAPGIKVARKHDMLEGALYSTDDSSSSANNSDDAGSPSPPADLGVMYSFDATRGPSHGSQILNVALAKAVEKFEDKETVNLVKTEYDMIDAEGESVAPSPLKKSARNSKPAPPDADEDYEFV